jgi:hypothetical protein
MWTYTSEAQTTVTDGQGTFVPCDPKNSDWQRIVQSGVEIAPHVPAPQSVPDISFAQLLIGSVMEGWITEAEGEAWIAGTLPAALLTLIATLPVEQRFAVKARALRPSIIVRADLLVNAFGQAKDKTPAEIDAFFIMCAAL